MITRVPCLPFAIALVVASCEAAGVPDSGGTTAVGATSVSTANESSGRGTLDVGEPGPTLRCPTPPGSTGRPTTIAEALEHIDALPAPVDVPCVLESLARPLSVVATTSVISAQPAVGDASPRFFVLFDGLILSFATQGHGAHLIEFAEFVGPTTSIKGELEFPRASGTLGLEAPFIQVLDDDAGTVCRLCHRNEVAVHDIYPRAFASDALAPRNDTLLDLDFVRDEAESCDESVDAHRCAVLQALFSSGDVVPGAFDEQIQTIFDYD